jgi:hypothetical protein
MGRSTMNLRENRLLARNPPVRKDRRRQFRLQWTPGSDTASLAKGLFSAAIRSLASFGRFEANPGRIDH